ncbi:PBP1A family penicillin-binding protein [candidate division KSB1 bacterium]|nr:PBP1A family penicillin-binding protein [candidate division KSB1 bacterium]
MSDAATRAETASSRRVRRTLWIIAAMAGFVLVLFLAGWRFYIQLRGGMPAVEQLENFDPLLSTKLLDRQGEVLKEIYTQRRFYTSLSETSPRVVQAILATEDHKFYEHWGIRPLALFGAVAKGVLRLDFHFRGASTLTQQLSRNLHYTSQRSMMRKLREALTAVEIERYYSKDEILEMYLTQTYFGAGAYGVEAAANTYFSKKAADLSTEEAALIAAIPKSPTRYNPINNPENAFARRNLVLGRMAAVGYLSPQGADSLSKLPIALETATAQGSLGIAPYFTEQVRQQLNGIGKQFGFDPYHDGVTVRTTIDARLQACAEAAVARQLPLVQKKVRVVFGEKELGEILARNYPDSSLKARRKLASDKKFVDSLARQVMPVQVAFVALDPQTGAILAMIGGRDFEESKFNRAVQAIRQPGSAFKPFVYASALDKGVPISQHVSNEEITIHLDNGDVWSPGNYDLDYGGEVDLRTGLKKSLNVVCVRLIREFTTPKDVAELARRLGITTPIDPYDALALGSSGVIPLDLVAAYQAFQSGGIWSKPMYMTGIDDAAGQEIVSYRPERKAVLSEETAFLTQSLLRTVCDHGTAAGLRSEFKFYEPAGGKTGTTNDYTDAWFVGFTPQLIAGVWVGLDDPAKPLGRGMQGARAALPIWAEFVRAAYDSLDYRHQDFPVPRGIGTVDVCDDSGELATTNCPYTHAEFVNTKLAQLESCRIHGSSGPRKRKPSLF